MLQVSPSPESHLFAGAHHQAFENTDFRISGRDMYHGPTVNVVISTPHIPNSHECTTTNANGAAVSPEPHARTGGRLWRLSRILKSRGSRKSQNVPENPPIFTTATSPTISSPSLSTSVSSSTSIEGSDDFALSSIVGDFDDVPLDSRSLSSAEVYVRFLSSGKGLACWQPKPLNRFSGPDGIVPGDVGTFSAEDGFRKTFNIWGDVDSIRGSGETPSDRCFHPPAHDIACHENNLQEGETVMEGAVSETTTSVVDGRRLTSTFEFHCHSPQGAVLALTSSANLLEAVHQTELHDTIVQHAELLYRHAESIRRVGPEESLYIVTSCLKSDSWALAAYKHPMGPPANILRLVQIGFDNHPEQPNLIYAWTKRGTSEAKCGESAGGRRTKDQSLFLRGFKLAFSPAFRARIKGERLSNSRFPDPKSERGPKHEDGGGADDDNGPSSRRRTDRGGGPSNDPPKSGGSPAPGRLYDPAEGFQIQTFPHDRPEAYHPCDSINKLLLDKTGADIALSHDDDWRFHTKKHSSWNGFIRDLLRRIVASKRVSVRHGVAFLKEETSALIGPDDLACLVFMGPDTSLPLWFPCASDEVELLHFSIPPSWLPAPMPTDLHLKATLGPLRKEEDGSLVVAFHRFLSFCLMIRGVRSVNGRAVLLYSGPDDGTTLLDCPPDPSLVVLGATWHTLRVWDATFEWITRRMLALQEACKRDRFALVPRPPNRTPQTNPLIRELDAIDELNEQVTERLQDIIEDLPFHGEREGPSTEYSEDCVTQRALFLDSQCESLRREINRLRAISSWQEEKLTGLAHLVEIMHSHSEAADSLQSTSELEQPPIVMGPRDSHEAPYDRVERWLESASRKLENKTPSAEMTVLAQELETSTHPNIIKLQQKALKNITKYREGGKDTLEDLLRRSVRCREKATTCMARGQLGSAFMRLTEAHTWIMRLAPRYPDYRKKLTEEQKWTLAFHGGDMVWELQDLEAKVIQGRETHDNRSSSSQNIPDFQIQSDSLDSHSPLRQILAHLSDQTPGPISHRAQSGTGISQLVPAFNPAEEHQPQRDEEKVIETDPGLRLDNAVKGLFGEAANVNYSFERPRTTETDSEYASSASILRPGASGWPRVLGTGRGETPELAIENASRHAYEALRTVYPEWVDYYADRTRMMPV